MPPTNEFPITVKMSDIELQGLVGDAKVGEEMDIDETSNTDPMADDVGLANDTAPHSSAEPPKVIESGDSSESYAGQSSSETGSLASACEEEPPHKPEKRVGGETMLLSLDAGASESITAATQHIDVGDDGGLQAFLQQISDESELSDLDEHMGNATAMRAGRAKGVLEKKKIIDKREHFHGVH
jgi:hypothetical protein